jgi:hypothetical protein
MREPRELIEECKKHLRDTKKYQHEYKTDIRKLITALDRALTIPDVVGRSEQLLAFLEWVDQSPEENANRSREDLVKDYLSQ